VQPTQVKACKRGRGAGGVPVWVRGGSMSDETGQTTLDLLLCLLLNVQEYCKPRLIDPGLMKSPDSSSWARGTTRRNPSGGCRLGIVV
jgi:hypothetical protein